MQGDVQRANFQDLKMNDFLVAPASIEELVKIGREELPDAPNLTSGELMVRPRQLSQKAAKTNSRGFS